MKFNTKDKKEDLRATEWQPKGISRIDKAAIILAVWGIVETGLLVRAIMTGTGFSGGCFFYIWFAFQLHKRNPKLYRNIANGLKFFTALAFGAYIGLIQNTFFFLVSKGPLELKSSGMWEVTLFVLIYSIGCPTMLYLLLHPESRKEMDVESASGSIKTLYIPKVQFGLIIAGGIIAVMLLTGPHILRNPYNAIRKCVSKNEDVKKLVGNPRRLTLKRYFEHNWTVLTVFQIEGSEATEDFDIAVSPRYQVKVKRHEERKWF